MEMSTTDEPTACLDEVAIVRLAAGQRPHAADLDEHLDECGVCRRLVADALRLSSSPASGDPDDEIALEPGDRVGRYVLLGRLGEGGAGVVFRAHDPDLDRDVAVKVLHPRTDPAGLLWEARTMARLTDPHVVPVYDVGTRGDAVYVVMQHVRGGTLQVWQASPRHWTAVVDRYLEAGHGLVTAHDVGIVHGDFKPSNVLLGADGHAMVADFGLASHLGSFTGSAGTDVTTRGGGSPIFASPEAHRGDRLDARSDQFSLCVALAWALFGRPPFDGDTIDELYQAKRDEAFVVPGSAPARGLWPVLERGLRYDPADRHASLPALLSSLRRVRNRGRRVARGALVIGVAGIGLAVGVGVASNEPGPDCPDPAETLSEVWSEQQRDALLANAEALEAPAVLDVVNHAVRRLDGYAAQWAQASLAKCQAGVAPRHPAAKCLERRRRALASLVAELQEGDRRALAHSAEVAWALPELSDCDDTLDEATRTEERRVWVEELDRIRVVKDLGRPEEAEASALHLRREVLEADDAWMEAEVHRELCVQLHAQQRIDDAWTSCEAAADAALRGDNSRTLAWAWTMLFALGSHADKSVDVTDVYATLAQSAVDKTGDPAARAFLLAQRGGVHYYATRVKEAREAYEQALAIDVELWGAQHLYTAQRMLDLAGVLPALDEEDEALRLVAQARVALRESIGDANWIVAHSYTLEGQALGKRGGSYEAADDPRRDQDRQGSRDAYVQAWKRLEALFGPDNSRTMVARAIVLTHTPKADLAKPGHFEELGALLAKLREAEGVNARALSGLRFSMVARLMDAQRNEEGVEACLPLVAEMSERHGEDNLLVGAVHNTCGILLERLGRDREALEHHRAAHAGRLAGGGEAHSATLYSVYRLAAVRVRLGDVDPGLVALLEGAIATASRIGKSEDFIASLEELLEQGHDAL